VNGKRALVTVILMAASATLAGCNAQLLTQTDLLDVDSTQNINPTGNFTVNGAWELKYKYDCAKQKSEGIGDINRFHMVVFNSDDLATNSEHSEVQVEGPKKSDVLHFKRPGTFYVDVDSHCDWRISIIETGGTH
jgi:hypothetical protein